MQPWHFHPIFVHFSLSFLLIASLLFIIAAPMRGRVWADRCFAVAEWNFWIGIFAAALTAITGLIAYFTVPNITAATRPAINYHLIAAVIAVVFYLILAFLLWRNERKNLRPHIKWNLALIIGIILLIVAGFLGGRLVFNYGVGVNALSATPH